MALPTDHSFSMKRGDDRQLTYTVVDQQDTPVVVDITGALIEWALTKQHPNSSQDEPKPLGEVIEEKSTATSGVTIVSAVAGTIRVDLDSADTVGLAEGDYYHELQMTLAGIVTTLAYGIIVIKEDEISPGP